MVAFIKNNNEKILKIMGIIALAVIPVLPLSGLTYGVDVSDVGFNLNLYRFFFSDISTVTTQIIGSAFIGAVWLKLCGALGISGYLGIQLLWVLDLYFMCFLSYKLFDRYFIKSKNENKADENETVPEDGRKAHWYDWVNPVTRRRTMVFCGIILAEILAKCNFNYFIYTNATVLFAFIGLYFCVVSLNEKKTWLIAPSVFFMVLSVLCKVSSVTCFIIYAVVLVDLILKKDWKYFGKQFGFGCLGLVLGGGVSALFLKLTCGIDTYIGMFMDMFGYVGGSSGSSENGHTLSAMIEMNRNGAVCGAKILVELAVLTLAIMFGLWICRKINAKFGLWCERIVILGLIAAATFAYFHRWSWTVLDGYWDILEDIFRYYNVLSVSTILLYICCVVEVVLARKEWNYRYMVLAIMLLTVILPFGSNTGISHLNNEMFFAFPVIIIAVMKLWKKVQVPVARTVMLIVAVWYVYMISRMSLSNTIIYNGDVAGNVDAKFTVSTLKGKGSNTTVVPKIESLIELITDAKESLAQSGTDDSDKAADSLTLDDASVKLLVTDDMPLLNYATGIAPFATNCGGWLDTEYISVDELSKELDAAAESGDYPIITINDEFAYDLVTESVSNKVRLCADFVEEQGYELYGTVDNVSVYVKSK